MNEEFNVANFLMIPSFWLLTTLLSSEQNVGISTSVLWFNLVCNELSDKQFLWSMFGRWIVSLSVCASPQSVIIIDKRPDRNANVE